MHVLCQLPNDTSSIQHDQAFSSTTALDNCSIMHLHVDRSLGCGLGHAGVMRPQEAPDAGPEL